MFGMNRKLKDVASQALELDRRSRATLAKQLLDSLEGLSEAENEQLWVAEAERRYTEFRRGKIKAVPGPAVFTRARARKG
jgi:putative addiction module component (TIGR02574 family)